MAKDIALPGEKFIKSLESDCARGNLKPLINALASITQDTNRRWVPSIKAIIVFASRHNLLTTGHYQALHLSKVEVEEMTKAYDTLGLAGLRIAQQRVRQQLLTAARQVAGTTEIGGALVREISTSSQQSAPALTPAGTIGRS